jgi:deoxyribodipyrimidine photo-lyase
MVVASFLVKDLGIDWRWGEKYFAEHLIDFDLAANNGGWQWASSSGCDAQPYFRIFNPISQSEKFDSNGIYIRKWVPELNKLANKFIHKPWDAPEHILKDAGITLGKDYPNRIIDLKESREEALEAYFSLKNN